LCAAACEKQHQPRVVLYTSIDEPIARPIIQRFERQTGIRVTLVTDSEASKTVGLAERLRAERANPQADVYWGNEPFHTINLAAEGVLAAYESPTALDVPAMYRDPEHRWTGNALRARVIGISSPGATPVVDGLEAMLHPGLRGRVAMARPTAGTTGGHVAAIFVLWGEEKAQDYFRGLRANDIMVVGGNSVVADLVGRGTAWAGLTDNDDVAAAVSQGGRIGQVLPDQHSIGTLMIPTTVGLVTGGRNPDPARRLIDYLLSAGVEQELIEAGFAGWSVRSSAPSVKAMEVDYHEVARMMPHAVRRATAILEGREQ
jgi:iron(III) transport system substrate-binding protein